MSVHVVLRCRSRWDDAVGGMSDSVTATFGREIGTAVPVAVADADSFHQEIHIEKAARNNASVTHMIGTHAIGAVQHACWTRT